MPEQSRLFLCCLQNPPLKELQRFLIDYLTPLHRQYLWGDDVMYHFAADNAMHPMYVQEVVTC